MKGPEDFDSFFAEAKRTSDAALVPNVASFWPHVERLGSIAAKSRIPAIGFDRQFAEPGGLLSHGIPRSFQTNPRRAAQVDRIFRGAKPADLPVEQPTKFELVVNLRTAKALGLSIPRTVILQADLVIE